MRLATCFRILRAASVATLVALGASTAGTLLGLGVAPDETPFFEAEPAADTAPVEDSVSAYTKLDTAENISTANPFCPRCVAPDPRPPAGPHRQDATLRSSLPLVLLATMESSDPRASLATIHDIQAAQTAPFAVEEQLCPGVTLLSVERGRVIIDNVGVREFIDIGSEGPPPQPVKPPPDSSGPDPEHEAIPGARDAIQCKQQHCRVDAKFVDALLSNPASLAGQARIRPPSGDRSGFGLYGIEKDSLPAMLGLENGDVLTQVNGASLSSMDDALELYSKLRHASHLTATVERKGKSRQITLEIDRD